MKCREAPQDREIIVRINGHPEVEITMVLDKTIENLESLKLKAAKQFKRKVDNPRFFYFKNGIELEDADLYFLK